MSYLYEKLSCTSVRSFKNQDFPTENAKTKSQVLKHLV